MNLLQLGRAVQGEPGYYPRKQSQPGHLRVAGILMLALAVLAGWGTVGNSSGTSGSAVAQASGVTPAYPLYAWGRNNYGQLGNGSTITSTTPVAVSLPAGTTAMATAGGVFFSLASGSDGNLYAWGTNNYGQLGNGSTITSTTPVTVSLPAGVTPTAIAAGFYHSLAIGSDNRLYAWGDNSSGQLGNDTSTGSSIPVTVSLPAGVAPRAIATGYFHNLAIGSDNKLYAWGYNVQGQLGIGTNSNSNPTPVVVGLTAPVTAMAIGAGYFHSLALGSDNKLYAWGSNQYGQLGDGTNNSSNTPVMVSLPAGVTPTAIAVGAVHNLMIGSDGKLYAWGLNAEGELGNGTNTDSNLPVLVSLPAGVTPTAIAAGYAHSLALGSDGKLYAWGNNTYGQLGNGTTNSSNIPLAVGSITGVTHPPLSAGAFHTLAPLAIPGHIAAASGSNQSATVGTAFATPLVATVRDVANNPISSVTVTFTAPTSGASGTFAGGSAVYTGTTDASGTVTATTFTANTVAGSYSLTATVSGVITPATFSLTNTAGSATAITAVSGGGQSTAVTTAFTNPLVVSVTDQYNNPVSGALVTFSPPASGASATFSQSMTTATTGANGQATSAALIANTVTGNYSVTATVNGISTPATFSLSNTAGPASAVVLVSGDNQQTLISTTFGSRLVAKVTDSFGNGVRGVSVGFATPGNGASATFADNSTLYLDTTDATGTVSSTLLTANTTAGSYTVVAAISAHNYPAPVRQPASPQPKATSVQYHLTNLAVCNPLVVTSAQDDGSCGTLRQALVAASTSPTKTVSIQLPANSVITLTSGLTLSNGVSISTTAPCGVGIGNTMLPPVTIQGGGANSGVGLTLAGHNQLYGLWVRGFSGVQIKAPPGSSTKMQCVRASKL